MVKIEEDLQLLGDQRDRVVKMRELNRELVKKKKRATERIEAEAKRKKRVERRTEADEIAEIVDAVDVEEETVSDKEVAEEPIASMDNDEESWVTVNLPKMIMESTTLCQTANRQGLSHRQVFATVASVIQCSSGDVENFLSPSTSRRKRVSD